MWTFTSKNLDFDQTWCLDMVEIVRERVGVIPSYISRDCKLHQSMWWMWSRVATPQVQWLGPTSQWPVAMAFRSCLWDDSAGSGYRPPANHRKTGPRWAAIGFIGGGEVSHAKDGMLYIYIYNIYMQAYYVKCHFLHFTGWISLDKGAVRWIFQVIQYWSPLGRVAKHHHNYEAPIQLSTPWQCGFPEWLLNIEIHHCHSNLICVYTYMHIRYVLYIYRGIYQHISPYTVLSPYIYIYITSCYSVFFLGFWARDWSINSTIGEWVDEQYHFLLVADNKM